MGVETFRADSDLSEVLQDKEFMQNFKNKTELYNTAVKKYYNSVKGKPEELPKPITKARAIKIV